MGKGREMTVAAAALGLIVAMPLLALVVQGGSAFGFPAEVAVLALGLPTALALLGLLGRGFDPDASGEDHS